MTILTTPGQVALKVATAAFLLLAIYLGALIGQGDFRQLKMTVVAVLIVAHVIFFLHQTWSIAFGICLLDLWFLGFGFKISSIEVTLLIAFGLRVALSWRKERFQVPNDCDSMAFRLMNFAAFIILAYFAAHLLFNHLNPYRPQDYSLKNFVRTVVWAGAPIGVLWLLIHRPRAVWSRNSFPKVLAWWILFALVFNIGVRVFEISAGAEFITDDTNVTASFVIPILDAAPNIYVLRSIPILGILVGMLYLPTAWMVRQGQGTRLLFHAIIVLSVIGALLSGGRATAAIVVLLIIAAQFMRGRMFLVAAFAAATFFAIVILNVFPGSINRLPASIQRSVAMVVFTQYTAARASIENSSQWRMEVARRAIKEWQTDRRTFWFGRGAYAYTETDERIIRADGYEGLIETSVRRGATHNLVTDLLLVHGNVGLILYALLVAALGSFFWRCRQSKANDEIGQVLATICLFHLGVYVVMAIISGGFLPVSLAWLGGLLVGHLYRLENEKGVAPVSVVELDPAPNRHRRRTNRVTSNHNIHQSSIRARRRSGQSIERQ